MAAKNSAKSFPSGAAPDAATRIRPPNRSRTFEKTSLSATFNSRAIQTGSGFPACAVLRRLRSQPQRAMEDLSRNGGPLLQLGLNGGVHLLPNARRRQKNGRPYGFQFEAAAPDSLKTRPACPFASAPVPERCVARCAPTARNTSIESSGPIGSADGPHIDVRQNRRMAGQPHLRLARRAGSQIKNGGIVGVEISFWIRVECRSIALQRLTSSRCSASSDSAPACFARSSE